MLLLLVLLLMIMETIILIARRSKGSLFVFLSSTSLLLFISSVLIYIAKKGGITQMTSMLLFGPFGVRRWMQYLVLTLGQLGYIVAIGRYLFPFFILFSAISFSYFPLALKLKRHWWILSIFPIISLVLYIPTVFKTFFAPSETLLMVMVYGSRFWIYAYIILTIAVLVYEYHSITSAFFRQRFVSKIMILSSLSILFTLYAQQDPAQIYLFYSNDYMWNLGLWYLTPAISDLIYSLIMVLSFIAAAIGFYGTIRYLRVILDDEHEEVSLRRKAHDASLGVSMFIHGTKNELLASKILISRMEKSGYKGSEITELKALNEKLLTRMERLRTSVSTSSVHLSPIPLSLVIEEAVSKAERIESSVRVEIASSDASIIILGDIENLSEAISNLIVNGWEATVAAGREEAVSVSVRIERLWVSVNIQDSGNGIAKEIQHRIWEPFYSSKNSSSNWGMGMYFARKIISMHLGSVRFETKRGKGTKFVVLLPCYDRRDDKDVQSLDR